MKQTKAVTTVDVTICDQCHSESDNTTWPEYVKCYCCYDKDLCPKCASPVYKYDMEPIPVYLCSLHYNDVQHTVDLLSVLGSIRDNADSLIDVHSKQITSHLDLLKSRNRLLMEAAHEES